MDREKADSSCASNPSLGVGEQGDRGATTRFSLESDLFCFPLLHSSLMKDNY